MAKVEVKFGDMALVIEGDEKKLPAYLEAMMKILVTESPEILGKAPVTPARRKPGPRAKKPPGRKPGPKPKKPVKRIVSRGRKSEVKPIGFGSHLSAFKKKVSQPREILVFADYFGKKFGSKDYTAAIREAGVYSDNKRTSFFNNIGSLI